MNDRLKTAWTHTKTVYNPAGTRHCWTNDQLKKHRVDTLYNTAMQEHGSSVQFSSRRYICAPPRLSDVSPTLPFKQFQCGHTLRQHNAAGTREFSSVQFSSVQDGVYALGKASVRSTRSLRSSPTLPLKRFQCSSD